MKWAKVQARYDGRFDVFLQGADPDTGEVDEDDFVRVYVSKSKEDADMIVASIHNIAASIYVAGAREMRQLAADVAYDIDGHPFPKSPDYESGRTEAASEAGLAIMELEVEGE